ncbi:MAG: FlgT C-terminal domain-containing protein [Thermodesulfobacteriota bacterium]|nr:FlgT C-terminal domain-containing protein [Thermodesulfobacteriota bacterium]
MRQMKLALSTGLIFFLWFLIFGEATQSHAQATKSLNLPKQGLRDGGQPIGYITAKTLPSWGSIIGSINPVVNMSAGEVVYIQMQPGKEVKPGDRFSIVRLGQAMIHPVTREKIGHLVLIPGELVILEGKDPIVTAKIHKAYRPIFLGDHIIVPAPVLPEAVPMRTQKIIEGMVIGSQEGAENLTQKELIFIDRGSQHGVVMGATFQIYQMGNFFKEILKNEKGRMPLNKAGEAVVVSVQEETSTALITLSSQAIYKGDKAVSGAD